MKKHKEKGLTIIQLMVVVLIAGIAGYFLVDHLIAKRCEANPSIELCANRVPVRAPAK